MREPWARLTQTFNAVTTNYSYDDAGQLLSDGTTSYSYDANGNLITAGADTYTWDWANRMTAATVGGNSASYTYDAFDVRVNGTLNGAATNYLWDRLAQYPTLLDDGAQAYIHGSGPQAQIDSSGNRQYLLRDALSSIRGVTDGSGALVGTADYNVFGGYRNQSGVTSRFGFTGEYLAQETGFWHLRARDLNPALGRFLSADSVQPNAPGTQGYNLYAYVANNPATWVDPSGFSVVPDNLTPAQTAIFVGLLVSLPAMALVASPIAVALTLFALTLRCALTEGCMAQLGDMQGLIKNLGSSGLNTVTWTAQTLNEAFAKYPLLPDASPPMRFLANVGLGLIGLDTITDFATLVSGRDALTGQELTPRELFYTWLALGIPVVTSAMARSFFDDMLSFASHNSDAEIGILVRPRGTLGADDAGHFAIYSNVDGNMTVRGYWPQEEGLPSQAAELFDLLFNSRIPGRVQDDSIMLQQLDLTGVVHAKLNVSADKARRLTELMGTPGPRVTFYSFNPDNFEDTFNCVTWGCSILNHVLDTPIQAPRQGRIKLALPLIGLLPAPWRVVISGPP